ncbi:SUN domain-containing protein 1-like isoform X2 [Siniperca chuatsi]|nr:SUN domain-containing protein 1-like isoform X2 [Siniperca chuatsi]
MSSLKIFGFLFFILPLCFGFAYLSLTLSSNFLDSGSPESPVSSIIATMDLNAGFTDMVKHHREQQDELLRLKKMTNYLLPAADTLPNFALESLGASVLFQLSSKTYTTQEAGLTFFGIRIWRPPVTPRIVIQGHSPLVPGCCWAFAGGRGHLVIALSYPVTISHVTLGHISKNLSPTGSISSAPKEFSVYGMETLNDEGSHLGTFLYDQDGDSVQTFKLPDHKKGVFNYVKLQVESNWGHPDYSCLYSFRVHGKLAD